MLNRYFNKSKKTLLYLCLCGFSSLVFAASNAELSSRLEFKTGPYQNNQHNSEILSIPDADALDVVVSGRTEAKYDILRIYDSKNRRVKEFSGDLGNIEKFTVDGSFIKVTFNSDGRKTDTGVTVKISAASPATRFNEIKIGVLNAIDSITSNGADKANSQIIANIEKFKALYSQVENANRPETLTRHLTRGLLAISESYVVISSMAGTIRKNNDKEFKKLDNLRRDTERYQERLEIKIDGEKAEMDQLGSQLRAETNDTQLKKLEITIAGKENVIKSLEAQVKIWQKFHETQQQLLTSLRAHVEKVELLLHILSVNAKVYREAAHVMELQRSMSQTLETLANLSRLEDVLRDIESSWNTLNELKQQINRTRL